MCLYVCVRARYWKRSRMPVKGGGVCVDVCVIVCVYLSEYMHVQVSYRVRENRENVCM